MVQREVGLIHSDQRRRRPAAAWLDAESPRWLIDVLVACAVAVVLGLPTVPLLLAVRNPGWPTVVAAGCSVVVIVCVAFRRLATQAAFAVTSAAMLLTLALPNAVVAADELGAGGQPMEIPYLYAPTSAAFLVVLHATAAYLPTARSLLALAMSVLGAVLSIARTSTAYGALPAGSLTLLLGLIALLAAVAGTWAVGRSIYHQRRQQADELARQAQTAIAEERRRVARDLHDVLAHSLTVIVRQAEGGAGIATKRPQRAADVLDAISQTGRSALIDLRGTVEVLRGTDPIEADQPNLAQIPALIDRVRAAGTDVHLVEDGDGGALTPGAGSTAYRIVQEAVTNAMKHAGPDTSIRVALRHNALSSEVSVIDTGGRPSSPPTAGAGAGLRGIRERVSAAGGTLDAGAVDGGYRVRATLPANREQTR